MSEAKSGAEGGSLPGPGPDLEANSVKIEIYALLDPRDGAIRYIGKANSAAKRIKTHLQDSTRRNTPVYCWIRKLVGLGLAPRIEVLRTVQRNDWPQAEREEIANARERGERLLNLAAGGNEPFCSTETRQANGAKNARSVHNDPRRKRIWNLKREMGRLLKMGLVPESVKAKLRLAAAKAPCIFGEYAAI